MLRGFPPGHEKRRRIEMPIHPHDWNVIVVGFWNRAIFTPAGISRHLFLLPQATPVQVLVPIDLPAPYRVSHEELTVTVGSDRLIVEPAEPTFVGLAAAQEIGRRALAHLPRTPLLASGINVRYRSEGPVPALEAIVASAWDERLSDKGLEIMERSITRSVRRRGGKLNVTVTLKEDQTVALALNLDLQSDDVERLRAWIDVSADDMRHEIGRILYDTLGVRREEVTDG